VPWRTATELPSSEDYELRAPSTVRRALSETLPEAVAAAAYEFITGPLLHLSKNMVRVLPE
jgi:hypothetical protein